MWGPVIAILTALVGAFIAWSRLGRLPAVRKGTVAFFHPFADGGGGGERVLWCAVQAVQSTWPAFQVVIYARSGPSAADLVRDAADRFNIVVKHPIQVVPLPDAHLVLPEQYPRFTLIMQAIGSMRLGRQALRAMVPEVFVDTTGWAFTYPLARWAGSRVACYVHYPTVSTDMLARVRSKQATYNNDKAIAGSFVKSWLKAVYYQLFALLYGACGGCAHVTMVNSSWTLNHVRQLWWWQQRPASKIGTTDGRTSTSPAAGTAGNTASVSAAGTAASGTAGGTAGGSASRAAVRREVVRVYPPVDTEELRLLPLERPTQEPYLVSVSQFRPEKNHRLQLEAYAMVRQGKGSPGTVMSVLAGKVVQASRLKMVGSCRNADDTARLQELQAYATKLGVAASVDWLVNVPYSQLRELLGGAVGGLHTMIDEHFGISVVEYMAAGATPIAHASGGPKADIIVNAIGPDGVEQRTGFLATTAQEYADAITQVLVMDPLERLEMAAAAQRHVTKFSTQRFMEDFTEAVTPVMHA